MNSYSFVVYEVFRCIPEMWSFEHSTAEFVHGSGIMTFTCSECINTKSLDLIKTATFVEVASAS